MSLYETSIPVFKQSLSNLDKWLTKAAEHAKAKSYDPNVLLGQRLAPDMYPLTRQVQSACDSAKFAAARLANKEAPKHPDTEQTMEELHTRIAAVLTYLDTFKPADFEGAETRKVPLSFMPGKGLIGSDYLLGMQIPNFFFHLTMAYAILRHNGVDVGKMDFIGTDMKLIDV